MLLNVTSHYIYHLCGPNTLKTFNHVGSLEEWWSAVHANFQATWMSLY